MMFPCLGVFLTLILVLTFLFSLSKQKEKEQNDAFWDRERNANATRKRDLSTLSYLQLPLESFELGRYTQDEICATEKELFALSEKKILNLNGISNTDLKLQYGTANLDFLSECDANCATLFGLLDTYASELLALDDVAHARTVLEYAVKIHSDISNSFLSLASIYANCKEYRKIETLACSCTHFDSYRKKALEDQLLALAHG